MSMEFQWDSCGISMGRLLGFQWIPRGFLWESYVISLIVPLGVCDISVRLTMRFQKDFYGVKTWFLCSFYGISTAIPEEFLFDSWIFYEISVALLWFLWDSFRISMIFLIDFYGTTTGFLWDFYRIHVGFPWYPLTSYDSSMKLLWDSIMISMKCLLHFHGISIGYPGHCISLGFLWYSYGFPWCVYHIFMGLGGDFWRNYFGFLWQFFVVLMLFPCYLFTFVGFLLGFHGISMGLLWEFNWMYFWNQLKINCK